MITIIFGIPRAGKTALMTKLAFDEMHPRNAIERLRKSNEIVTALNNGGYNFHLPKEHLVFSDYPINFDLEYERVSYEIDGFYFGLPKKNHRNLFIPPCSVIFFDEAQKYYNSREHTKMSDYVSRAYEWHGHMKLDIYIACQRAGLIDLNIRELACRVIEVVDLTHKYDDLNIVKSTWTCNVFDNAQKAINYIEGGKVGKLGEKMKYTFEGNIFHHYNSFNFMPAFFKGKLKKDFDLVRAIPYPLTREGIKDFNDTHPIAIPETYYKGGDNEC